MGATALGTLGEKLGARSAAAEQIVATMQETNEFRALSSLGHALGAMGEQLDATSAAAEQIVAVMKETTDYRALCSLALALGTLGEQLDATSAVAEQIVAAMKETPEFDELSDVGFAALGALGGKLKNRDLVAVLKSVVCVGEVQNVILRVIKNRAGWETDGNLWMAVKWAEEQGVDVNAVPRWPLAP